MRRLLVVVDYQKDFVDGALGFKGAELIEENIIKLIKEFRAAGDEVIFTLDTHDEDYLETVEGKLLPVVHCIKGTEGWQLTDGLKPLIGDSLIIEKPTFPSLRLGGYIHDNQDKYDEIYLCGLVSDICVFSDAVIAKSACSKTCTIKVVRNATSSYDLDMQETSFKMLKNLHIEVI